jgi:hypothetical protein
MDRHTGHRRSNCRRRCYCRASVAPLLATAQRYLVTFMHSWPPFRYSEPVQIHRIVQ